MAEQLPFYLFLSFATPSALSSPLAGTAIEAAARDSPSSLRIVLRLAFDFPFPTAINIAPNTSDSGPVSRWDALHALLALAYNAATRVLIERGEPLCSVEVILEGMRNVPLVVPEGAVTRRVDIPEDRRGALPAASWPDALGGRKGQYSVVALGGTFDHLHAGHKILLTMAAFICTKRLIVGVTHAALLGKKKLPHFLQTLAERENAVVAFLQLIRPGIQHDVVPIEDIYGPTATDPAIEALVVSEETRSGGEAVNVERDRKGLSQLDVFVIDLVAADAGPEGTVEGKMGSTAIREWLEARGTARV